MDKFQFSPAYAGFNNNIESFLVFSQYDFKTDNAPSTILFSANGAIYENMGVGGSVKVMNSGIFSHNSFQADYAYHLKLNQNSHLNFSLGGLFINTKINFPDQGSIDIFDPEIPYGESISKNYFNAGFSLNYQWKALNIGAYAPQLIDNKIKFSSLSGTQFNIQNNRELLAHITYYVALNDAIGVSPLVIYNYKNDYSDVVITMADIKYNNFLWMGIQTGFGEISQYGIYVGMAFFNRLAFTYSYSTQIISDVNISIGIHELNLGFLIGKNNSTEYKTSVFPKKKLAPYYQWE